MRGAWPAYAHFGHWGSTTIPHATWSVIVNDMKALRRSLAAAREPSEVEGLGFLFAHLRDEFASDFDANRAGLARMIDALCDWLQAAIARSIDVTIIGV